MDPLRDDNPSVPEHPAEVLFAEARFRGIEAANYIRCAVAGENCVDLAVMATTEAARDYHEAQRASGECDRCGERLPEYDYIVAGERYAPCTNCHEPEPVTFERAMAQRWSA